MCNLELKSVSGKSGVMKNIFYLLVCVVCAFSCKKSCDTSVFGDHIIINQNDIDNLSCFLDGGSKFDGKLILALEEDKDYDWSSLENLNEVESLTISNDEGIPFLDQIVTVNGLLSCGGNVTIASSKTLRKIGDGILNGNSLKIVDFPLIEEVSHKLYFSFSVLEEIRGFEKLKFVEGLYIDECPNLKVIPKFEKLETIDGTMHLRLHDDILPDNAFSNLKYCKNDISMHMYCDVTDFSYFENLEYCPQFAIIANYLESDLCELSDYASIEGNRIQVSTFPAFGAVFFNEQIIEACD